IASNGDVFISGKTSLGRFESNGDEFWSTAIRGATFGLQFAPDFNPFAFTTNGWFQIFAAADGHLLNEQNLTPGRTFSHLNCVNGQCAYLGSPAVDVTGSRIYVTYAVGDGTSAIQAYSYNPQTYTVSLLWQSAALQANISSPVLSADY